MQAQEIKLGYVVVHQSGVLMEGSNTKFVESGMLLGPMVCATRLYISLIHIINEKGWE